MCFYFEGLTCPLPYSYLPPVILTQLKSLPRLTISMILVFFPARFFLATMYWARTTPPNRAQTLALAAAPTFTTAVLSMTVGPLFLKSTTARSPVLPSVTKRLPAGADTQPKIACCTRQLTLLYVLAMSSNVDLSAEQEITSKKKKGKKKRIYFGHY